MGILHPIRNTTSIRRVKMILFFNSGIFPIF
jgi:hypothetical protein